MIIKGLNIFLTCNQYSSLMTNEVREKINELPSIDPTNINKVLNQKNKILCDEVEARFRNKKNATEFLNSWMKFDIVNEEAKENTWNILNDYCSKNDYSYLRDKRSLDEQLTSESLGNSYSYFPMSKTFSLIYNIPEKKIGLVNESKIAQK